MFAAAARFFGLAIFIIANLAHVAQGDCFDDAKGQSIMDGERWNASICRTCICNESIAICSSIRCATVTCSPNETLALEPNECCPRCQELTACHSSCSSCNGASDSHCTACADPMQVLMFGQCLDHCQDGFFTHAGRIRECRECHRSCARCSAGRKTNCTLCYSESYLETGECVSRCSRGFYATRGACLACPTTNCDVCSRFGQCTRCEMGYVLLGNACTRRCPARQYANRFRGRCESCSSSCDECVDASTCRACVDGTFRRSGRCVTACGDGYYQNSNERLCERNTEPPFLIVRQTIRTVYGGLVLVNDSIIRVGDPDTNSSKLLLQLVSPPSNGKLIRVDGANEIVLQTGSVFSYVDAIAGHIQYIHDRRLDSRGDVALRVSDRQLTSPVSIVSIVATSPYPPVVVINTGIVVEENGRQTITERQLRVEDRDDSSDSLIFILVDGPNYGHVERLRTLVQSFTARDVERGVVRYVHDGAEVSFDDVRLQVVDGGSNVVDGGSNVVEFLFRVNVTLVDDEPPTIVVNSGLVVNEGATIAITSRHLEAHDVDSDDDELVFTIARFSSEGTVVRRKKVVTSKLGSGGWTVVPGTGLMEKRVDAFAQKDVTAGRIYYNHSGSEALWDEFRFTVSDASSPPNVLRDQVFSIRIIPLDDESPRLVSRLSYPLSISVDEGTVTAITGQELAFADADTDDSTLVYSIVTPPRFGLLELSRRPNVSVDEFTQRDVDVGVVRYRTPNAEIGTTAIETKFRFRVSDGTNRSPVENFAIIVNPVNNRAPEFGDLKPLVVEEGDEATFNLTHISASDADAESTSLLLAITQLPDHGTLTKEDVKGSEIQMQVGTDFTLLDVARGFVKYEHDGSETRRDDFGVSISDGKFRVRTVIDVVVTPIDNDLPRLLKSATKRVNVDENSFKIITRRILAATDSDTDDRQLVYTLTRAPVLGQIYVDANNVTTGDQFTQGQVDDGAIIYVIRGEIGPAKLRDSFVVSVSDDAGNRRTNEEVIVVVAPVNNIEPTIVKGDEMRVEEGGVVVFRARNLLVRDEDTVRGDVVCRVTSLPKRGYLESDKAPGVAVNSFTTADLDAGRIRYVQNQHFGIEPDSDSFVLQCTDGAQTSPATTIDIVIEPVNDETPVIGASTLQCPEDGFAFLTNQSLSVTDLDSSSEDLVFVLIRQPAHGRLTKAGEIATSFTARDLANGRIAYEHSDGTTARSDRIEVTVSDEGGLGATATLRVLIVAVDDETPRVIVNAGLRLNVGESALILPTVLRSSDIDTPDDRLIYTLSSDPSKGRLRFLANGGVVELTVNDVNSFTQSDIDAGRVQYEHVESSGGVDLFKFNVTDGAGNDLFDQDFIVHIFEDRAPPRVMRNTGLVLKEGSSRKLTTDVLSATDANSDDSKLVFTVVDPPLYGRLAWIDWPRVPVRNFTQVDLAAGAIEYRHLGADEGQRDRFRFTITDGTNVVSMIFSIVVEIVDDSLPVVTNRRLRLSEGERKAITPFELNADDSDTEAERIVFTITSRPRNGRLDRADERPVADSFTMREILDNEISYVHDGTNTIDDSFKFKVSDSTNVGFLVQRGGKWIRTTHQQSFHITIVPIDDGAPRIITNKGLDFLTRGVGRITSERLKATDDDTEDKTLLYTIQEKCLYGDIVLCQDAPLCSSFSSPVLQFTQADLDNSAVVYVKSGNATSDRFTFSVADATPNSLQAQTFDIRWSQLSFENAVYVVRETGRVVELSVRRSGNLNVVSYVSCRTIGGTATSDDGDYVETSARIQFEENEKEKTCTVPIIDDVAYENEEFFAVILDDPVQSLIGNLKRAKVIVNDTEDEPRMSISRSFINVNESGSAHVDVLLKRTGDTSDLSSVVCYTEDETATGGLEPISGSDFIRRADRVYFLAGETEAVCTVDLIDDSLYELAESFHVKLSRPSRGTLGDVATALVTILGPNDEPRIRFSKSEYVFGENDGRVSVDVLRDGPDLQHYSRVWCAVDELNPVSAKRHDDFVPTLEQLVFAPHERTKSFYFDIVNDVGNPELEGNESLSVALQLASGATLKRPARATVYIDDSVDDAPSMSFSESTYFARENETLAATVVRTGDTRYESSVTCSTRASAAVSATPGEDYVDESYVVRFMPGETVKACKVTILDDSTEEPDEMFSLILHSPVSGTQGRKSDADVVITNPEDVSRLQFDRSVYKVLEPVGFDQVTKFTVAVVRSGDASGEATVHCSTRDGLAVSAKDYQPFSEDLTFKPNQRRVEVTIEVLYSAEMEWEETFNLILGPPVNAVLGERSTAQVQIVDRQARGSIVLPDIPAVVSLLEYDAVRDRSPNPSPGYPVVCVLPCDPRHPNYDSTRRLCESENFFANRTKFRWEVAPPRNDDGIQRPFDQLDDDTVFTSTKSSVLDSIYFCPRCLVRCSVQPYDAVGGSLGSWYSSQSVVIGWLNSICGTKTSEGVLELFKAESFIADLDYIDGRDSDHANHMKIRVQIPHQDGLLPVLSTVAIDDLKFALSKSSYRQRHVCSNLLDYDEWSSLTSFGFISPAASAFKSESTTARDMRPHQFDSSMRGANTVRLYRHLDLNTCLWTFEAYYHMTELVDVCGGTVTTNVGVRDETSSELSVTVPLHVAYVYTAPTSVGWRSLEHSTEMKFSFSYSAILWRSGVSAESSLRGNLQVMKALIRPSDGRFEITFKTDAKFRGKFVLGHLALNDVRSRVEPPSDVAVRFDLVEMFSESSFDSPAQWWRASSLLSTQDYTGTYAVFLIPCTVKSTDQYEAATGPSTSSRASCTPHAPVRFDMAISFTQVSQPVPEEYRLDTEFVLHNSVEEYLTDPKESGVDFSELAYSGAFSKGQTIYGRVLWDPSQDLRRSFKLTIESVFLCSGRDGFQPYYDPKGEQDKDAPQYGCLRPSPKLAHRFKLLDRLEPDTVDRGFNQVPFRAEFAADNPEHGAIIDMAGVDGFNFVSDPLYEIDAGRVWHLQVLYQISSAGGGLGKRSVASGQIVRTARDQSVQEGTNMGFFEIDDDVRLDVKDSGGVSAGVAAGAAVSGFVALVAAVLAVLAVLRFRRAKEEAEPDRGSDEAKSSESVSNDYSHPEITKSVDSGGSDEDADSRLSCYKAPAADVKEENDDVYDDYTEV